MPRLIVLLGLLGATLTAGPVLAGTPGACEAAKERAIGAYSRCLLVADAKHAKDVDDALRSTRRARCRKRFDWALARAERGNCGDSHSSAEVAHAVEDAVDSLRAMVEDSPEVVCPIDTEVRAALTLMRLDEIRLSGMNAFATKDLYIFVQRLWPDYIGAYCYQETPEPEDTWVCGAGRYVGELLLPVPAPFTFSEVHGLGVWNREMTPAEGKACGGILSDAMKEWFGPRSGW